MRFIEGDIMNEFPSMIRGGPLFMDRHIFDSSKKIENTL
jgi:hypothetical protein